MRGGRSCGSWISKKRDQNLYVLVDGAPLEEGLRVPSSKAARHRPLPPDHATALARSIRQAREEADLTQEQVAASSRVSVQLIRRLEAGTANPTLGTLTAVAAALGVSVSDLTSRAGL
jgi:DNA-binding XRE family transcriptional regulator